MWGLVILALVGAGCSSDSASTAQVAVATNAPATTDATAATTATDPPAVTEASTQPSSAPTATSDCEIPDTTAPIAADDLGNERDWEIISFDETVIRAHWFPRGSETDPAPTVLMGPGWGSAGDTDENAPGLLGALSIKTLRDNGYNVLTWDPRGFGESTGTVEIDSVDYEARDVQQLLDWVATQPEVQLDASGDPRAGMVGASYGGGIQFVTAAIDCRVDAIVPIIAWNSLKTSLYKANTPKTGWGNLLSAVSVGADVNPFIPAANQLGNETGTFSPEAVEWFADRGPDELVSQIDVPTLIIQGTVDTLFTLDEAVANYRLLEDAGVTTSMLWFCGGHGVCLTNAGDESRASDASIAWLDRYVKEDESVDTGAGFEFVDQDGVSFTDESFPEADGEPVSANGSGTLDLVAEGGAGPAPAPANFPGVVGSAALLITPGRAGNAVNVTINAPVDPALIVGAPTLQLTYSGTVADGERPMRVFAQLVDDATGVVLGNQITPIEVILDGAEHTTEIPLETVAHRMVSGTTITLQLVATTVAYAQPRLGGNVNFSAINISLPVVTSPVANAE